jgi:hypothetical protein
MVDKNPNQSDAAGARTTKRQSGRGKVRAADGAGITDQLLFQ